MDAYTAVIGVGMAALVVFLLTIALAIAVAVWVVDHHWRHEKKFVDLADKLAKFDERLVRKENEQIEKEKKE